MNLQLSNYIYEVQSKNNRYVCSIIVDFSVGTQYRRSLVDSVQAYYT